MALLVAVGVLLPVGTPSATGATVGAVRIARDVVVYGGTPAGVAAAVAAARHGARVTLLAERGTVGGLMSNGIGATDVGSKLAVHGIAADFFSRVRAYYRDSGTWRFEPRIAERVFRRMLAESRVQVRSRAPLNRVTMTGDRVTCVVVPTNRSYCAKTFVDASYTGDIVAAAGVPHRLGMGDLLEYGETLAAQRKWVVAAKAPSGEEGAFAAAFLANPFVRTAARLPAYEDAYGQGTPSLTYRLCVTPKPGLRVPFRPAANYAALLPSFRYWTALMPATVVRKRGGSMISAAFRLAVLPAGKYDLNSGHRSFTNLPAPGGYFDTPSSRRYWNMQLRWYVESFFYFIQHDPTVPAEIQRAFSPFGLCADEFVDNGNWPREPYVREARRIVGQYTVTQRDVFTRRTKSSAIALGSYNVDGKLSQLLAAGAALYRDQGVHATAPVYEIPYGAMAPRSGPVNLLVPVGVSASPTAYGSLRMEPQYMAMGQAAGIAAALGARYNRTLRHLPVSWVQARLRADGARYKALDVCRLTPRSWRTVGGFTTACTAVLPMQPRPVTPNPAGPRPLGDGWTW